MAEINEVVVMICGPHHQKEDGSRDGYTCSGTHDGTRCFSRVDAAVAEALRRKAPLVICGDANEGRDVRAFHTRADAWGVASITQLIHPDGPSDTHRDLQMAVQLLLRDPEFAQVTRFVLVTDHWHMPRASMMAVDLIANVYVPAGRMLQFVPSGVHCWEPPLDVLERERDGCADFAAGDYQSGRHGYGKPALEKRAVASS